MLSDEEIKDREKELKEMGKQIEQVAEETKDKATEPEIEVPSSPEPTPPSPAPSPESAPTSEATITHEPPPASKVEDDPMKWAEKKGFKTPEDMARALLQKERKFHEMAQEKKNQPPPPPQWAPQPEWEPMPENGYPPPPPAYPPYGRGDSFRDLAAMYPQVDPEDLRRFMPIVMDVAESISNRKMRSVEKRLAYIDRNSERNNELISLMQDPAFTDSRVQREIHSILDSDPSIFNRERTPIAHAYEKAMVNLARRQLQQGGTPETVTPGTTPPVTAGGGNGSAYTAPRKVSESEFNSWTIDQQRAFINSKGRSIPKR